MNFFARLELLARRIVPRRFHRSALSLLVLAAAVSRRIWARIPGNSTRFGPPRRFSASVDQLPDPLSISIIPLYEAETQEVGAWHRLGKNAEHHWKFRETSRIPVSPACIYRIPRARIVGQTGYVIDSEDRLLSFVSREMVRAPGAESIFGRFLLPAVRAVSGRVAIVGSDSATNYYHWLFQTLPRFHLLDKEGTPFERLYVAPLLPYQRDSLEIFGLDTRNLEALSDRVHIAVDEALVPSPVPPLTSWTVDFLRGALAGAAAAPIGGAAGRRLYLSRARAGSRRIAREDELFDRLQRQGFERVFLEELSFADQVRLMKGADVLVGPHGAGMANLVFCNPGALVIEIFSPAYVSTLYGRLAQLCGHRYFYYIGSGRETAPGEHDVTREDIELDPLQAGQSIVEALSAA